MKAEIGIKELIKEQIQFTMEKAKSGTEGGDWSNLAGGDWSNLAGGNSSIIVGRNGCKAKSGLYSVIVLTEWKTNDNGKRIPVCVKAEIVDGDRIKADTWYKLENGEFVEAAT